MRLAFPSFRTEAEPRGSAILLVLFFCLCVAVVIQALVAVTLCVQHATADEGAGRERLSEKDAALAWVRQELLSDWAPVDVTSLAPATPEGGTTEASATEAIESQGWLMEAVVRHDPDYSRLIATAVAERGRDGLDLPIGALVAGAVRGSAQREADWEEGGWAVEAGEEAAASAVPCYLVEPPVDPALGPGCSVVELPAEWGLDEGWVDAIETWVAASEAAAAPLGSSRGPGGPPAVAPGPQAVFMVEDSGHALRLPWGLEAGRSPDTPVLVVVTGGADLDAEGLGDLCGVIVVDGGSVELEGTAVHGAVFVTGEVWLGETGRILYSPAVLRWATDRSLQRVRLVPGTRWEGLE